MIRLMNGDCLEIINKLIVKDIELNKNNKQNKKKEKLNERI